MENADIKERINQTLDHLNSEQLALVERIFKKITSETPENTDDPLAQLRNSDFIGCFADEPDLAQKSEEIAQRILAKKDTD